MGNFEKLVVLTVLFLAAIILGVTLHEDGSGTQDDPLGGVVPVDRDVALAEKPAQPEAEKSVSNRGTASSLVEKKPATTKKPVIEPKKKPAAPKVVEPKPVAKTAPSSLFKTTAGLEKPAFGDEYLLYTWRTGDTIAAVADRYYGDRKLRYLIRNNNEGAAWRPGDKINLPFYDTAADAGTRPAFEPAPAHKAPVAVAKEAAAPARVVQTYTVKDGDSLWGIAKDAYGKGTKWEQIFKANRDQLDDSSDLKPGMVLRIP
jgi:nucleoid-associated protein YgaU